MFFSFFAFLDKLWTILHKKKSKKNLDVVNNCELAFNVKGLDTKSEYALEREKILIIRPCSPSQVYVVDPRSFRGVQWRERLC